MDTGKGDLSLWPTPNAREKGGGEYQDQEKIKARIAKGHQTNLGDAVKMWPTPTAMTGGESVAPSHLTGGHGWNIAAAVHSGMWPTPSAREPGWKNIEVVDRDGNPPRHHNQRFYDKKTGRVVQKGLQQTVADPKTGGQLNPQWVAWLMGYPTEYLSCVPWETRSNRKGNRKCNQRNILRTYAPIVAKRPYYKFITVTQIAKTGK